MSHFFEIIRKSENQGFIKVAVIGRSNCVMRTFQVSDKCFRQSFTARDQNVLEDFSVFFADIFCMERLELSENRPTTLDS